MKIPNKAPARHHKFASIPDPKPTLDSLVQVCTALKEAVEVLTNQRTRGQGLTSVPTWNELIDAGVVSVDQVPMLQDGRVVE